MGLFSSKKQTVGYKYYLGMLQNFCQGPVDAITHLYWEDDMAWSGTWTGGILNLDLPDLFGGEDKEGGVSGDFELHRGHQLAVNSYLAAKIPANRLSAYYGTTSIVARRPYLGNSPYIKAMSAVVQSGEWQRPGVAQWYLDKLKIMWNANVVSTPTDNEFDDTAIREGMDVWIVFSGVDRVRPEGTETHRLFAKEIRRAINRRINAIDSPATPASKKIGLGIAEGGCAFTRLNSDGDNIGGSYTSYVTGATQYPGTWDSYTNYDLDEVIFPARFVPGIGTYTFGTKQNGPTADLIKEAVLNMGNTSARRTLHPHGVLIILDPADMSQDNFNYLRDRYISAGGTFQRHTLYSKHFARSVNPVDFVEWVANDHIRDILENKYPAGSDTAALGFADASTLGRTKVNETLPSQQGYDVNPVHILRECIVSPVIGLGEPAATVDNAAAVAAADLLYDENFGISLKWSQEGPVEEFMQLVCNHANITCYVSNLTGMWVIKPIRGDYNENTIPVLDEAVDLVGVDSLVRRSPYEGVNAITVKYHDIDRNDATSIPVYNTAAIQMKDGVIDATTVNYDGIIRDDLAYKVGERDLLTLSYPVVTGAIYVDRTKYYFEPGDVFRLDAPSYGVYGEVMRIADVDYGDDDDLRIRLDIASDIYALEPQPMDRGEPYIAPPVAPPPQPMQFANVSEASYYLLAKEDGRVSTDTFLNEDPTAGAVFAAGPAPAGTVDRAQLRARVYGSGDSYRLMDTMSFSPGVILNSELTNSPNSVSFTYDTGWDMDELVVGEVCLLDEEYVRITGHNKVTKTITVARGLFDTVPVAHGVDSSMFAVVGYGGFASDNYLQGDVVEVKMLPASGKQVVSLSEVSAAQVTMAKRAIRPYPAANLMINGAFQYVISSWTGEKVFTWEHRNRKQQINVSPGYKDPGISPEAGLTYIFRVRAWDATGAALAHVRNINIGLVDTYTVDLATIAIPDAAVKLSVEIVATRGGHENWSNVAAVFVVPFTTSMGLNVLWYDANRPNTLHQNEDGSGDVDSDGDNVRSMTEVSATLPA